MRFAILMILSMALCGCYTVEIDEPPPCIDCPSCATVHSVYLEVDGCTVKWGDCDGGAVEVQYTETGIEVGPDAWVWRKVGDSWVPQMSYHADTCEGVDPSQEDPCEFPDVIVVDGLLQTYTTTGSGNFAIVEMGL